MIGTILDDRWRILAELGRGGMGEVYLAEHLGLGRKEALKILMPSLAADPQFVSRFRRESRAVNRLRHPNIIAVYDFGQLPDKRFYLAMEYAEGPSVYRLLKQAEFFTVPRALHVLGQLTYAVHHAHSRGVLHRDLKPDNLILVGDDELVKVLDFGVAKIVAHDHAESLAISTNNLVWGSPRYMAPERIRGSGSDPRSDLYAIGVMAFELVVGSPPFLGSSNDVIKAHLNQAPEPPSEARPEARIPPELDAVVLRCMAKSVDERYQTAAEVYAAFMKVPGFTAKPEPRRRHIPVPRRPSGDTGPPEPAQRAGYGNRGVLGQLAEALLDLGLTDTRLVGGLAKLRDHERALAALEAAQAALGERAAEHDVAKVAESRATALERLITSYDALERTVEELLPPYVDDPIIAPLAARLVLIKRSRSTTVDG